jgi:putative ABC transport system substrate-binding protein
MPSRTRGVWLSLVIVTAIAIAVFQYWQSTNKPVVIGTVQLGAVDLMTLDGFIDGMSELGYIEGKDVIYLKPGPAGQVSRLQAIIDDQLATGVDLFFVSSSPGTLAVKQAAEENNIPAVFGPVNDPIKAGVVTDMQHPGGQLTGVRLPPGDDLRMQWFGRAVPGLKRLFFPYNPNDPSSLASLEQTQISRKALGIELELAPIYRKEDIPEALSKISDEVDGLFLARDSTIDTSIKQFVEAANKHSLPLCASSLTGVREGVLVSYGFDHYEIGRQAAHLADQVLKGVPVGDLPIETASNYLGINLDTAKQLGIEFSAAILRQAHLKQGSL